MGLKILSPLSRADEVEDLIEAGVDEFYCGVLPENWREKYTIAASLNRRQEDNPIICTSPHMGSFEELARSIQLAHAKNIPVILTINEHYYSRTQYPYLEDYIENAISSGIDAFIVGDLGLLLTLREMGLAQQIHISTAGTAFNAETIHFYRDLGASRVILPRHLALEEVGEIAQKVTDIELEAFILNSRCANVDGLCTFQHGLVDLIDEGTPRRLYENACMLPYEISAAVEDCEEDEAEKILEEKVSWEKQHFWTAMHIDARPCGVCALYEFEEMGLAGVKIVGRQNASEKKIKDVKFIRQLLNFLRDQRPAKTSFREYTRKLYQQQYQCPCLIFKCYYPSVLMDK
jgi:collagenase-like PrtC family protease